MKVKRFFYVTSEASNRMHFLFGRRVEGGKLACGRRLTKEWYWAKGRSKFGKRLCTGCMASEKNR